MKKVESNALQELSRKLTLNSEEKAQLQAHLNAHPEDAEIRKELRLNQLLNRLPDAPVASNFTARVLQAAQLEEAKAEREQVSREHKRGWPAWRVGFGWVSRLAMAGFIFMGAAVVFHQSQVSSHRSEFAQSVQKVSQVAALPTDWLDNFDTINRLDKAAPADDELLAALQ